MSSWFANWWFSESKEKDRLKDINKIFADNIGSTSDILNITNDAYPVHIFTKLEQSEDADDNRIGNENFFGLTDRIIETIEDYIVARNQRYFGSGHPRDALSLVLLEMRNWALNSLTKYGYNDTSIELLNKRKAYLQKIIEKSIFKKAYFGKRIISKDDAFISIMLLIDDCISTCKDEKQKQNVRDHLKKCRDHSVDILNNSLYILYLLSDPQANKKAIDPNNYLKCSDNGSVHCELESKIYKSILSTENGQILKDIILLSGSDAPGIPQPQDIHAISDYYDINRNSIRIIKRVSKIVPYDWTKENPVVSIEKYQDLGEHFLQFSKIAGEIESRYADIGNNGNNSFNKSGLIFIKVAIAQLKLLQGNLVSKLSEHIKSLESDRGKYLYDNHINNKDHIWKTNFEFISKRIFILEKLSKLINSEISKIEILINSLPTHIQNDPEVEKISIERVAVRALRFPISVTNKDFTILNKSQFRKFKDDSNPFLRNYANGWKVGDSYELWSQGFLTLHQDFFDKYNWILDQTIIASQNKDVHALDFLSDLLTSIFNELISTINFEKPQWRFKYFIIPVSLGWPFHSTARSFAKSLVIELENRLKLASKFIISRKSSFGSHYHKEHNQEEHQRDEKAPSVNQQIIATRRNKEAEEFIAHIISPRPSNQSDEKKEDESKEEIRVSVAQDEFSLDKWSTAVNEKHINWFSSEYTLPLKIFSTRDYTQNLLGIILDKLDRSSASMSQIFIDSASLLYQSIDESLKSPILRAVEHNESNDQAILLMKLLDVVMSLNSDDRIQKKNEFETCCKNTFDKINVRIELSTGYSSHGLLRANSSAGSEYKSENMFHRGYRSE